MAKRFGEPKEFGAACAFLCSDDAGYITGQLIGVNGGWLAALKTITETENGAKVAEKLL